MPGSVLGVNACLGGAGGAGVGSYVLCLQPLHQAGHSVTFCCFSIVIWQVSACFFSLIMYRAKFSALEIWVIYSEAAPGWAYYLGESCILSPPKVSLLWS